MMKRSTADEALHKARQALKRITEMEAAYKEMYERVYRLECVPEEQGPIPPYPKGTELLVEAFSKKILQELDELKFKHAELKAENAKLKTVLANVNQENNKLYNLLEEPHPVVSKMIELKKRLFGL